LLEYTSAKYAAAASFGAALTTNASLCADLRSHAEWVKDVHRKIDTCPTKDYNSFNDWVLKL